MERNVRNGAKRLNESNGAFVTESIQAILNQAAARCGLSLTDTSISIIARRIAQSLEVQPRNEGRLAKLIPAGSWRLSAAAATDLASEVRRQLKADDVNPLFDLPLSLARDFDVFVFPVDLGSISGGCMVTNDRAFIFISNRSETENLFICAHELAHLISGFSRTAEPFAIFDPTKSEAQRSRGIQESFADAFARQILITDKGLGVAVSSVRKILAVHGKCLGDIELLYLARIFGVSFLEIAKRCEVAGLLPKGGALSLNKFMANEFGGPEKRADSLGLPSRPIVNIEQPADRLN